MLELKLLDVWRLEWTVGRRPMRDAGVRTPDAGVELGADCMLESGAAGGRTLEAGVGSESASQT